MKYSIFTRIIAFAILISPALCGCQADFGNQKSISWAKRSFEKDATTLSLPVIGTVSTKTISSINSVFPLWEEAIVTNGERGTTVEAPLSGNTKIIGSVLLIKNGKMSVSIGTTKSYLVVSSVDGLTKMYVETFIEQGNSCKMHAFSDKSKIVGFQIISDLSGNILEERGFGGGKDFIPDQTFHGHDLEKGRPLDFVGVHWDYATCRTTKAAGEDEEGCPEYMDIMCSVCGEFYFGNINDFNLQCPQCGNYFHNYYHGKLMCPYCWNLWENCTCDPQLQECASCGRIKGNCNGCGDGYCSCE